MRRARGARRPEAGQAVPLVVGVLAVGLALVVALVPLSGRAVDAARARTAADAAALAAASRGAAEAAQVARANGATVVRVSEVGGAVVVEVRVGRATASARAVLVAVSARHDE